MKSPRILLIGIGGVYNYGCEAIIRGTETIIRREYPNAEILYASRRVTDDQKRLNGTKIQTIKRNKLGRFSAKNICRKLLSIAGIKWDPMADSLTLLKDIDVVFSIGGDIYTLRPDGDYPMSFPKFGDAAVKRKIPYIQWGASIGPFTQNPKVEKAFTKHLKGLSLITAREAATVDYLHTLGIASNVVSCADPAYVVAHEIKANGIRQGHKFTIGVNLSPLSILFTEHSEEDNIQAQAKTLEGIIQTFDASIVLIPHVVSDFNERDDDLRYLRKIKNAISSKYQASLKLLDRDQGFIASKKELVKCDVVVAVRMHCAINALAAHVPTILITYSSKGLGMCNYVYGKSDWALHINEFTKEGVLEKKIRSIKDNEAEVRGFLSTRIPEIQHEAYRPLQSLKKILGHI